MAPREAPPLPLRLLGQAVSLLVARFPALWPRLRDRTRRFWERSASGWDERVQPDRPEHLAPFAAAVDLLDVEPSSILEIGTGTGAGAVMLARRFPNARVRAVDLSPAMVEAARAKLPAELTDRVELAAADAAALPFEEASFDLVAQLNVPVYLDEIARVLRPGGHLIVGSSLGRRTPYHTPHSVLARQSAKRGLASVAAAETYFVARRDAGGVSEAVRRHYDKTAGRYDRQIGFFERVLFGGGREWVCAQAEGETLEIAVGTGRNLGHYPPGVRLTGIELSPGMLDIARHRTDALGVTADLRVGDAQALEFADDSFDTVTCTLALCTIPDDRAAVQEMRRVLRPGGRLLLLEHVRSPLTAVRAVQHLLEPLFLRLEHDHLTREPLDHVRAAGFQIERVERSKLGIVERLAARK